MRIVVLALLGIRVFAQAIPGDAVSGFTIEDRLRYYVHRTYSWQRLTTLGGESLVDHLLLDRHGWRPGPDGLTQRYGAAFAGRIVRNSIELSTGILFHEDTRFQESHQQGLLTRLRFASSGALLAQGPDGQRKFAYSRLAATAGGILICSTWRPRRHVYRHYLEGMADGYLSHLENSLFTEFSPDMVRFGKKVRFRVFGR